VEKHTSIGWDCRPLWGRKSAEQNVGGAKSLKKREVLGRMDHETGGGGKKAEEGNSPRGGAQKIKPKNSEGGKGIP